MSAPSSSRGLIRVGSFSSSTCAPCEDSASSTASAMQFESSTASAMQFESSHDQHGVESTTPQQHQTGPTNVGELVAKAKKAAASLWMILHAQNCRLPKDKCPHRGCADTKLLLAHVKACPAGPDFPCPSRCKGCNETRKLLAHYRRCKDLRTKQVGLGRRSLLQPDQGSCLVCSLVARYAKGMLDRTSNGGTSSQGKSDIAASLLSSSMDGKFNVERGLVNIANLARLTPIERTPSMTLMPPPPPRYGSCPSASTSSLSNESFTCSMRSSLADDAAVMTYPSRASAEIYSWSNDPSSLGKSVDTSVSVSFPILRRSRERIEPTDDELIVPGPNIVAATSATSRRQRAGSYDERKTRVKFAPAIIAVSKSCNFDDREGEDRRVPRPWRKIGNSTRPRSASCSNSEGGNAATSSTSCEFDAIVEEGAVGCEEPMFSMDL